MATQRKTMILFLLLGFGAGIIVCVYGPRLVHISPSRSPDRQELQRVTSSNERFDAVMILEQYGGAIGGDDWYVYIVPKGKSVSVESTPVFSADELDHERLVWKQPHLLEIQYDVGEINSFRNLWCSHQVEDVGSYGEKDYCVEIRLTPSSPDSSILDSSGNFRHVTAN